MMAPPPTTTSSAAVLPRPVASSSRSAAEREVDGHVARSIGWQAGKIAIQIAQYVVLARLVAPAEYGKYALALPVMSLLSAINDGGLSTAAVTGQNYDKRLASDLYMTQLGLGLGVAALMGLAGPVLAAIYGVPELREIAWWLAASLGVNAWSLQPKALLRRHLRIGTLALVEIGGVAVGLGAAWGCSRYMSGFGLLVVAQVTNVAVSALLAATIAPVGLAGFRGGASYRHALQVGRHMVASDVLNAARSQVPAFVLGFFVVLQDIGLYNRANQLLNLPLMVLAPALTNFLLPLLARDIADPERRRSHVRRTLRLLLTATIPGCVWIAIGPANLLAWVLGAEWRPAVAILSSLSPLFVVQLIAVTASISMVSAERSRTVRRFAIWNLVLTAAVVLVASPFGVMATALALSISGLLVRAPIVVGFAIRERTFAGADVIEALRTILTLGGIAAALVWICAQLPVSPLMREIVELGAVAAVSGVALLRVLRGTSREVSP